MTGEIVEFPGNPPPEGYSEQYIAELHSQAFRDLEGEVCDLERAGAIALSLIMECTAREDSYRNLELAQFAISQVAKMAEEFKANYEKRWHGELRGAS